MFTEVFWVITKEDKKYVQDELVSVDSFLYAKRFNDQKDAERFLQHDYRNKFSEYKPVKVNATYVLE